MKKLLATGLVLAASMASAQEVPFSTYVGDGAIPTKVYGGGFLGCDKVQNTCKLGDNVIDFQNSPKLDARFADAFAADPTNCGGTDFSVGIDASGTPTCRSIVSADLGGVAILSDGTVGYAIVTDSQTTAFTPNITACAVAQVTITSGTGNFTLNAPTGIAPTGFYQCSYLVKNQSGSTRDIVFGTINTSAARITTFTLSDNSQTEPIIVYTEDAGANWFYDGGALDFTSLPATSDLATNDLLMCQNVSDSLIESCTPNDIFAAAGGLTASGSPSANDYLRFTGPNTVEPRDPTTEVPADLGLVIGTNVQQHSNNLDTWSGVAPTANITTFLQTPTAANLEAALTTRRQESDIDGDSTIFTNSTSVTSANHGETVVCNNATGMNVTVNTGAPGWTTEKRVYVFNVGAGDCTVQTGSATVVTATGFTATVPQYAGATIIGINTTNVAVTGGAAQ